MHNVRIPGLKSIKRSTRWLRSRFVDGALILGYHRVADEQLDPYDLCITPQRFAEHLDALKKYSYPMHLEDLLQALWEGHLPKRAVALTFDDGYADTLYTAKPLLESYQIPATVFITTGYMGGPFWWDDLARLVLTPETLLAQPRVTLNGRVHTWGKDDKTRRHLLEWLYQLLQPLAASERHDVMAQIESWSGAAACEPIRHALLPDEVVHLADGGLIDVGAHTVTHPVLTTLSPASQRDEIVQSKTCLETLLHQPVTGFAYPHGALSHDTVRILQESGLTWACSSFPDIAWRGSDRFALPRFWTGNWEGDHFTRWLRWWINR